MTGSYSGSQFACTEGRAQRGALFLQTADHMRRVQRFEVPSERIERIQELNEQRKTRLEGTELWLHDMHAMETMLASSVTYRIAQMSAAGVDDGSARGVLCRRDAKRATAKGRVLRVVRWARGDHRWADGKDNVAKGSQRVLLERGVEVGRKHLPGRAPRRPLGSQRAPFTGSSVQPGLGACSVRRINRVQGLVIDEASMVDLPLALALFEALPDDPTLPVVWVGDADQLPSVGPGRVLGDLVASGTVPSVACHGYRQGERSGIVVAAHDIQEGRVPRSTAPATRTGTCC